MGDTPSKSDWLLILLRNKPLDRIRLMKALFLIWHRSDRSIPGFFTFVPYLYGPCSFELYEELDSALKNQLITQPSHVYSRWASYFLTQQGEQMASASEKGFHGRELDLIQSIAQEVGSLPFNELLRRVYKEAPDFSANSVVAKELAK